MAHRPVKTLPDGTRRYSNYTRYKPLSAAERTYAVRKPDHPQAQRFHGQWFLPLDVLPDNLRQTPETVPDDEAYEHAAKPKRCKCYVCKRPQAAAHQERYRRDVTAGSAPAR